MNRSDSGDRDPAARGFAGTVARIVCWGGGGGVGTRSTRGFIFDVFCSFWTRLWAAKWGGAASVAPICELLRKRGCNVIR